MFWERSFPSFDASSFSLPHIANGFTITRAVALRGSYTDTPFFHFSGWLIGGTWLNALPPVLWNPLVIQPGQLDLALVLDSWGCHCGWRDGVVEKGRDFGVKQTWVWVLTALSMSCWMLGTSEPHLLLVIKPTLEVWQWHEAGWFILSSQHIFKCLLIIQHLLNLSLVKCWRLISEQNRGFSLEEPVVPGETWPSHK